MRFIALTCPGCSCRLTVSSNAPATVTCPNCLSSMANPSKGDEIEPIPVIPVEQASSSDRKVTTILLAFVGIMTFAGALAILRPAAIWFSGVLALIAAGSVLAAAVSFFREKEVESNIGCGIVPLVILIVLGVLFLLFGACALTIFRSGF